MSYARSGHHASIQYGKEGASTFKTFPAMTRAWGYKQEATGINFDVTTLKLASIGSPLYESTAFGNFQGTFGIEHVLSNPWWLDLYFDAPTSTGTAPVTHTYPNQTTYPNQAPKELASFGVEIGIAQPSPANMVLQYAGCVLQQSVLSAAVNEYVSVKHSILYAKTPVVATTLDATVATEDVAFPYTYIHGTLNIAGVALATIQNVELTINQNSALLWGFGSAEGEDKYKGLYDISGKATLAFKNKAMLDFVLAKTEPSTNTMSMKFTNGGAAGAEKSIDFQGTGISFPSHSIPEIRAGKVIFEDIPFDVRIPKVIAKNAITLPP